MGLEVGEFIADLVQTNPVTATDSVTEGSDHLRLLKKVLQQSVGLMPGLLQFADNNKFFSMSNVAADGFINMIKVNLNDEIEFGAVNILFKEQITLANTKWLKGRNFANDGDVSIARINTGDGVVLGDSGGGQLSFRSSVGYDFSDSLLVTMANGLTLTTGDMTIAAGELIVNNTSGNKGIILDAQGGANIQLKWQDDGVDKFAMRFTSSSGQLALESTGTGNVFSIADNSTLDIRFNGKIGVAGVDPVSPLDIMAVAGNSRIQLGGTNNLPSIKARNNLDTGYRNFAIDGFTIAFLIQGANGMSLNSTSDLVVTGDVTAFG